MNEEGIKVSARPILGLTCCMFKSVAVCLYKLRAFNTKESNWHRAHIIIMIIIIITVIV